MLKALLRLILGLIYRVEVNGLDHLSRVDGSAVIIANHVSLIDAPLLAAFLPGKPMFAVNSHVATWWWVKPFLRVVDAFPLDPTNPLSLKSLIREVETGRQIVIFPEGRLTETGSLMKVYDGPGLIADKTGAPIIPVRLDGVQYSRFARLKGKKPRHALPRITITILPPVRFSLPETLTGQERRVAASGQLQSVMEDMVFRTTPKNRTLFEALLEAGKTTGCKSIAMEDHARKPVSYRQLVRSSVALGRALARITAQGENVGILLPTSTSAVTAFFALQSQGRVAAMLNFSAGSKALLSACHSAQIRTVLTSRQFIEAAKLEDLMTQLGTAVRVVYLEDIAGTIGLADKLAALFSTFRSGNPDDPAVVLFTSGSEGAPKGVVLSHANLLSNIAQLSARVDFNRQDVLFNCLPVFHSFGLTGGTLLPILSGVKAFLYPNPLHYRAVPELVYSSNATIMFGTDTFLQGYARAADAYDFYRMRYVFAGAEKVREETTRLYREKFNVPVLEGYGATECSPAIAVNAIMQRKDGTVGRILPGMGWRLIDVPGITEGGRLHVTGPNVMLGYYLHDAPGVIQPPEDGWHDTGDIVSIDDDGFLTIRGRARRFAKIGGEMVSLTAAEQMAEAVWPESGHAVIALPDPKKGEQLLLLTTRVDASREALSAYATEHGIPALSVPANVRIVSELPKLATGKTDYAALNALIVD